MNDKTKQEIAEEERKKIDVQKMEEKEEEQDDDDKDDNEEEKEEEKSDNNSDDGDKGDNEENKEEEKEADDKEKEEAEKKAKLDAKQKRQSERVQKRIDKAMAEAKAAKEEVARLQKQLEDTPDKKLSEEDAEHLAEIKANEKVIQREFVRDCNKLADDAEKLDKAFPQHIAALTEEIGPIPSHMIAILSEVENGAEVLNHLSLIDNVDEAEDIWKLSPGRMAARIAKLSVKLEDAKKKPHKEISKLPDPPKPLGGKQNSGGTKLHDKMPMADWVEQRERELAEKRERKKAAYR